MAGLDRDGQASGSRRGQLSHISAPAGSSLHHAPGNLLKGAVNGDGELKDASLMVGIKLDLEAEVHLTARVRGDITVGLY
ncbi:hypothetical protein K491DRAFT_716544 [Lophiostoma macrostomum CBS 122681]|uniref:Uncharacterized protein n=1 Tax=Lophiostoma macrostomum CBS 122681 TaxID=1314788 RepID=A0A6A6T686_9PLEO|nr:hypothetical protein K491DRAFT_716544 [Lophiostoma macrostomum CBS 122681]